MHEYWTCEDSCKPPENQFYHREYQHCEACPDKCTSCEWDQPWKHWTGDPAVVGGFGFITDETVRSEFTAKWEKFKWVRCTACTSETVPNSGDPPKTYALEDGRCVPSCENENN